MEKCIGRKGGNASSETLSEGRLDSQKANEARDETNATEEKSSNEAIKETEKEVDLSEHSEKDSDSMIQVDVGIEAVKDGEN